MVRCRFSLKFIFLANFLRSMKWSNNCWCHCFVLARWAHVDQWSQQRYCTYTLFVCHCTSKILKKIMKERKRRHKTLQPIHNFSFAVQWFCTLCDLLNASKETPFTVMYLDTFIFFASLQLLSEIAEFQLKCAVNYEANQCYFKSKKSNLTW